MVSRSEPPCSFKRHAKVSESGAEIRLPAVLVPDASNPFDGAAVAVFVDGLHVGYLERPDAAQYHRPIAGLPGGEVVVVSRQWLRGSAGDTWARVTLSLPLPDQLQCPNPLAGDCVSLPAGSTIQVTREEDHMGHLVDLLDRYGSESVVAASLRSVTEQRPRSTVELVAVDIDGEQVGVLSTTQTANFLALVRRAEAEGRKVSCRASLRGNSLKADVALHARKAHELDEKELADLFVPSPHSSPGRDCRWLASCWAWKWREVTTVAKSKPSKTALSKAGKTLASGGSSKSEKSNAGSTLGKG